MTITAEEFARQYAKRSGVTVAFLKAHGRDVRPCSCGEPICEGWQMVNAEQYDADLAAYEAGEGPHP